MIMRKKVIISLIYVSIVLTIPLAVACQGSNDDSIDPNTFGTCKISDRFLS